MFNFTAWKNDFTEIANYVAICEAKSNSNIQDAFERALSQLHERDMVISKSEQNALILPIVFLKSERQGLKEPREAHLNEV